MTDSNIDEKCINTIRCFCADVVQKANSGHPGAPMGMAPIAHVLWTKAMKYSPSNPSWFNRDRFVLSNGHACALQYSLLHLTGYEEFTLKELQSFRQLGSKTPGHPENSLLVNGGIEVTTGPLGQGISSAVGLAIAEAHLASLFNKPDHEIIDHFTYVFCGDGCLQEGVSSEASSLAGVLGLGKLIVFYDDNKITIDGSTELSWAEDVNKRYEAYGWQTLVVENGDTDINAIQAALAVARQTTDRPTLIRVRTTIGIGSAKQGTEKVHGSPLGVEEVKNVKRKFGLDPEVLFNVPEEVKAIYGGKKAEGKAIEDEWNARFQKYAAAFPELAAQLKRRIEGKLPEDWKKALPTFTPADPAKATRQFSQIVINALGKAIPELVGGSADLNPSTLSYLDCSTDFNKVDRTGRNIRFGVREHGMAAVSNGLAAHGGLIPYAATFFNFIGYAIGAVRISAISHAGVIYVMTHDSIGLGEDGPTHQPIESLMMVRAMPNILVFRPADGNETSGAYAAAIENRKRPSVLALSRQGLPNLKGTSIEGVYKGGYTIHDAEGGKPDIILTATGSELHLCVNAVALIKDLKVRVVSLVSWELFREQSVEYQLSVFPEGVPVLAVEAAAALGWSEYAHAVIAMTTFGESAPAPEVFKKFGFFPENIAKKAAEVHAFYQKHAAGSRIVRP